MSRFQSQIHPFEQLLNDASIGHRSHRDQSRMGEGHTILSQLAFIDSSSFGAAAQLLLAQGPVGEAIARGEPTKLIEKLAKVSRIYMDIDGTAVAEGTTQFSPAIVRAFERAQALGVAICIGPTGKPAQEAGRLLSTLPTSVAVEALIEKGAFRLSRTGTITPHLIAEPQLAAMARLREQFFGEMLNESSTVAHRIGPIGARIERECGVVLVPAGDGQHRAVLSLDVLPAGSSREVAALTPAQRREIKLKDPGLMQRIMELLACAVAEGDYGELAKPRIVDLGNGNIELTPASVEKDLAVAADIAAHLSETVLVIGDSQNDRAMLELGSRANVISALVLHSEPSLSLIPLVHLVVKGEAMAERVIEYVVAAKR